MDLLDVWAQAGSLCGVMAGDGELTCRREANHDEECYDFEKRVAFRDCPECDGHGGSDEWSQHAPWGMEYAELRWVECPDCEGRGWVEENGLSHDEYVETRLDAMMPFPPVGEEVTP